MASMNDVPTGPNIAAGRLAQFVVLPPTLTSCCLTLLDRSSSRANEGPAESSPARPLLLSCLNLSV